MSRRHRCSMVLGALTAQSLVLTTSTVMAHPTTQPRDLHAAAAGAIGHVDLGAAADSRLWAAISLIAGVGLLCLLARRLRGRAIALGLTLALGIFTLWSAVHSVHHLARP